MTNAEQFFFDNAGWSYHPATESPDEGRKRCARRLALAEEFARDNSLWYVWEDDPDADDSFVDTWDELDARKDWDASEHTCEQVTLFAPPNDTHKRPRVVASLGGIWDATAEYRRVVEAELAEQAMEELK